MAHQTDPLKVFRQHGFEETGPSGDKHVVGNCIFCGGDKFLINESSKLWDCKHCGREGGYQLFLQEVNELCQRNFTGQIVSELRRDRGLSKIWLKRVGIGYNPVTQKYTFPMYEVDGKNLWNIYIYNKKGFIGTSGGQQGLLGWEQLSPKTNVVWLCEGHWDYTAMREILDYMEKDETEIALGVPGVAQFKDDWIGYFKGKTVFVVYDGDHDKQQAGKAVNPGKDGAVKVFNRLSGIAREIKFVHWPDGLKDGYDLRDCYIAHKDAEDTYNYLVDKLNPFPKGVDLSSVTGIAKKKMKSTLDTVQYDGEGLLAEEVYKRYTKWLRMKDTTCIDVFYGTIIANRLPGDPIWLFLVGPSGCGKSELLLSIAEASEIYSIDELTPHTLVSGSSGPGGSDPSLIPQLDGMVLCIKDFTTILEMNANARDEIFGQLRSAYDGKYNKPFGIGILRAFDSKFGIVTGVTPAIELYTEGHTALGERFLRFPMPMNHSRQGRRGVLQKALDNVRSNLKDEMRTELENLGKTVMDYDFGNAPEIDDEISDMLIDLADWTAIVRGTVVRDRYSKEVTHKPFKEIGTRLVTQFSKLAQGITMFRRKPEVTFDEYKIIRSIAIGCAPSRLEIIIRKMYKKDPLRLFDRDEIASAVKLPPITVDRMLENMYLLGVLEKVKQSGLKCQWCFESDFIDLMKGAKLYE